MLGLYIHIPFCVQKCRYCDFVSYTNSEELFTKYVKRLLKEAEEYKGEKIDTVFIGGGTPTVLNVHDLQILLTGINNIFRISSSAEITCEANPGTVTSDKARALSLGGVNRISVGVQTFNDDELKIIGRIHDADMAYNTICELKKYGINNINIDIMTSLPGQNMRSLANTLNKAVSLPITHISAYSLILEEGTPIKKDYDKGIISVPGEEEDREMYYYAVKYLEENGFKQYEISNFAKPGYECRHNLKYWNCEEYIGLGAASHSYIGDMRFSNSCGLMEYMLNNKRSITHLNNNDKISEFMMMGLRKIKGINKNIFKKRFGLNMEEIFGTELVKFISLGLMSENEEGYFLTKKGIDISNSIMCEFML